MSKAHVSFILAARNADQYLEECIKSIIAQSYENWELIIVVNCSTDKSLSIAKNYQKRDERIKVFQSDIGQLNYNLNLGLDAAEGTYIARIDADDINHPDRLAFQVPKMKSFDIVGSNVEFIDENSNVLSQSKLPEYDRNIRRRIFYRSVIMHPTIMIKKSLLLKIGGYQGGKLSEDYDLWLLIMRDKKNKFYNIQSPLVKYRLHNGQMSVQKNNFAYVSSYFFREALLTRSIFYMLGTFIYLMKFIFK